MNLVALKRNVSRCKLQLMSERNTVFFSSLLSNLKLEITDKVPTAATNGIYMHLNPEFISTLTIPQLLGLMLHEVMHVVYDHISRCLEADLDHKLYNIAGDHLINLYLLNKGYELPKNGYANPKYIGWSTMQIYKDLLKNPPPDYDQFQMDIVGKDADMREDVYREKVISNIIKAVQQAQISNQPGSIPGHILILLEEILNPKLPWYQILQNYMNAYSKDLHTWSRPNRRYMPDFLLPTLHSDSLNQITCGDDVSGSMTKEDIAAIFAEQKFIWETLKPKRMRIQTFDTLVHMDKMFEEGDTLDDIELMGGGGTNVEPLIQSIRKEQPEIALIFTDGYFSTPDMTGLEATDIFWIIKGNDKFQNPMGTIIHF